MVSEEKKMNADVSTATDETSMPTVDLSYIKINVPVLNVDVEAKADVGITKVDIPESK